MAKFRIYHKEEAPEAANCALWVLKTVLAQGLKLLHPFMPFITEEIYGALVPEEESLMCPSGRNTKKSGILRRMSLSWNA